MLYLRKIRPVAPFFCGIRSVAQFEPFFLGGGGGGNGSLAFLAIVTFWPFDEAQTTFKI